MNLSKGLPSTLVRFYHRNELFNILKGVILKHPYYDSALASGAVAVVDVEEEMEDEVSQRSNDEQEHVCANDVNSIEDHDEDADGPDKVDEQSEVEENHSNIQIGMNNE